MYLFDEIEVPLSGLNIQYYENLGYDIPRMQSKNNKNKMIVPRGSKIRIKVDDLPSGSNILVPCVCDFCGKKFVRQYNIICRMHKNGNRMDSCGSDDCKNKCIADTKINKYGTTNTAIICDKTGVKSGRPTKYNIEDVVEIFLKTGRVVQAEMIEAGTITLNQEIPFICPKHESAGIQYTTTQVADKSKCCCILGRADHNADCTRKATIEEAMQICDKKGYTILTKDIRSVDDKIEYICKLHEEYGIQTTTLYGLQRYNKNCRLCCVPSGENHPNWHGGIDKWNSDLRKSWEYRRWRQDVYKKDCFICKKCGKSPKETKLNAHHIINFSEDEALRYDVNNGATLCQSCHQSFHKTYGTHNNTQEQLNEFLEKT